LVDRPGQPSGCDPIELETSLSAKDSTTLDAALAWASESRNRMAKASLMVEMTPVADWLSRAIAPWH